MATVLQDAEVTIDTFDATGAPTGNPTDLTDFVSSVTLNASIDTPEATAMGDVDRVRLHGIREWSAQITFFQDFGTDSVDSTLWDIVSNFKFVQLNIKPSKSKPLGVNNPQYSGRAILPQHSPLAGAKGEVSTIDITFQSSGELTRSVTP